jgi:hypothetical protein
MKRFGGIQAQASALACFAVALLALFNQKWTNPAFKMTHRLLTRLRRTKQHQNRYKMAHLK